MTVPSMTKRNCRGLRMLSPDLIEKARDETATRVNRILLTFGGTFAFCLLSLFSPDSALLGDSERLNVPLAGPVSFFGFMLLGPAALIVLRVYLQIYVEHHDRLDRIAQRITVVRAPTLVPLKNPLLRTFHGISFYLLLPIALLFFAWKAAVFPAWGSGLLCIASGVIASHAMLPLRRLSCRSRVLISVAVAILSGGIIAGGAQLGFGPPQRPFDVSGANLSNRYLRAANLFRANLSRANLTHADLSDANLRGARLTGSNLLEANLTGASLAGARLSSANLTHADLSDASLAGARLNNANLAAAKLHRANLEGANLNGANLSGANLSSARFMDQAQLNNACGMEVKLPTDLTLNKPCPTQ